MIQEEVIENHYNPNVHNVRQSQAQKKRLKLVIGEAYGR